MTMTPQDEARELADLLGHAVVCYDMYGKEIARAKPRGSDDASVSPPPCSPCRETQGS